MRIIEENKKFYAPSGIIIGTKEPANKDLLWIHIHAGYIEVKLFSKGWKVLFTSKDIGLSEQSTEQVNQLISDKAETIMNKVANNSITFIRQIDDLKRRVEELEKNT